MRCAHLLIAVLVLAVIAFFEAMSSVGWLLFFIDDAPQRFGAVGPRSWLTVAISLWVVEVARLSVLAMYWRAVDSWKFFKAKRRRLRTISSSLNEDGSAFAEALKRW